MPSKNNKERNDDPVNHYSGVWEKRSVDYGSTLKSVLFQGMPEAANEHFHATHINFILDCLKDGRSEISILDVGCGYGRLSLPIVKKYPRGRIVGLDISPNYVKLYRENTFRDAFVGSVDLIPPQVGTFDYIIVVTVLMYLPENKLKNTLSGLFTRLNPNGRIIIIEPNKSGIIFQTACGLTRLLRKSNKINTGGKCFRDGEINAFVHQAGGIVIREERIPATTFFFLPIFLLSKILPHKRTNVFFRGLTAIDDLLKNKKLPTLWSFYLLGKNNSIKSRIE